MIPVRLSLRNFMCYRDDTPAIEFDALHTAVLCGDNGAGKSALLAAMTWALWGEARENVTDEDLITQGENDMTVDFEFRLDAQHYRVLRKRTRRNNKGMLTFQVATEDGWRDISGHTLRETQKLITEKLRMDYATFTNSAFLMQGRADAFTTKTPAERKEILGTILGLSQYDVLTEQARAEGRERDNTRKQLYGLLEELNRQIANKPGVEQELAEATAALLLAEADADKLMAEEQALRTRLQLLATQETELANVQGRMAQDERDVHQLRGEVDKMRALLTTYENLLQLRAEIVAGHRDWKQASERETALNQALGHLNGLQSEKHNFEKQIDAARGKLESDIRVSQARLDDLRKKLANRATLQADLEKARAEVARLAALDAQAQQERATRETLRQEQSGVEGENSRLHERMTELKARREAFEAAVAEAERLGAEHCPMCGTMLDPDGRARVLASYEADIVAGRETYRANLSRIKDLKARIADLDASLVQLDDKLKVRRQTERSEQDLERSLNEALTAAEESQKLQLALDALQARFAANDFAAEARAGLASVEARLTQLSYDPKEHERVRSERVRLAPFEDRRRRLDEADEKAEGTRRDLANREEMLRQREARFNSERLIAQELQAALRGLDALKDEARTQEAKVRVARYQRAEIADRKSKAEGRLRDIEAVTARREGVAKQYEHATYEKSIYEELAKAFGKSGVQAMIIESVMPELQDEANALLARMTDGRMVLSFETQRQAKTTDSTIETLDIKISDDNGIARRYELFSGGEAFRINFAVRIALSKLLARRAGAQLQTLIIDEGFGSQDGQGRERLIQAIRSIEQDFEKIFIITHIQELKDEFPSRIEVVRTAGGSIVSVN